MHNLFGIHRGQTVEEKDRILRTLIGVCPALIAAASAKSGLVLGLCALCILLVGNALVSLMKGFVSEGARPATSVVVYGALATIADMLLHAYAGGIYGELGIGVLLLALSVTIITGAGEYAASNPVGTAVREGFSKGLLFTVILFSVAAVREALGSNTLFGYQVFGSDFNTWGIMSLTAGGFFVLALVAALFQALTNEEEQK